MSSSPVIEIEFPFQDLLVTLNYFGCIPKETAERWKTRQNAVALKACNLNCFQIILGTELSTSIQKRHHPILIKNLVPISGQSASDKKANKKKSKRKQNVTEQKGFQLACQTSELVSS